MSLSRSLNLTGPSGPVKSTGDWKKSFAGPLVGTLTGLTDRGVGPKDARSGDVNGARRPSRFAAKSRAVDGSERVYASGVTFG